MGGKKTSRSADFEATFVFLLVFRCLGASARRKMNGKNFRTGKDWYFSPKYDILNTVNTKTVERAPTGAFCCDVEIGKVRLQTGLEEKECLHGSR